ncbi:MAG: tetratricopeptide repeat protein [Gemmatimonadaceae bacterium]
MFAAATVAHAQSAAEHVAAGNREHEAFHPDAALKEFEAALAIEPKNVTALQQASLSAVDLGEGVTDKKRAAELFRLGEKYAREAVTVAPDDPESHFHLARALGRAALNVGVRDRVKYAVEIREQALAALKVNPEHPGALHVIGMWNAEVMRLNGFERFFAKNVLGGKVFGLANWNDAVSNLEHAVRVDPKRPTHRLDLGMIYRDVGEKAKAREALEAVIAMPQVDVNDGIYKQQAKDALAKLK